MYSISNAFLTAVKANTRKYYWTGQITTKGGAVYEFDQDDIVKGSGTWSLSFYKNISLTDSTPRYII